MANNPLVRVVVPVELEQALRERAIEEDRTYADIVRRALRAYVDRVSHGSSCLPDSDAEAAA
jgi:hypothetical protein